GSSCVRTGCQTGSSNPSTTSSTTVATPGTPSSLSRGRSCPSPDATGRPSVTHSEDWYNLCFAQQRSGNDKRCDDRHPHHGSLPVVVLACPHVISFVEAAERRAHSRTSIDGPLTGQAPGSCSCYPSAPPSIVRRASGIDRSALLLSAARDRCG